MMPKKQRDFCYQIIIPDLIKACKSGTISTWGREVELEERLLKIEIADGLSQISDPEYMFKIDDPGWRKEHLVRRLMELTISCKTEKKHRVLKPVLKGFYHDIRCTRRKPRTEKLTIYMYEVVYNELVRIM